VHHRLSALLNRVLSRDVKTVYFFGTGKRFAETGFFTGYRKAFDPFSALTLLVGHPACKNLSGGVLA